MAISAADLGSGAAGRHEIVAGFVTQVAMPKSVGFIRGGQKLSGARKVLTPPSFSVTPPPSCKPGFIPTGMTALGLKNRTSFTRCQVSAPDPAATRYSRCELFSDGCANPPDPFFSNNCIRKPQPRIYCLGLLSQR